MRRRPWLSRWRDCVRAGLELHHLAKVSTQVSARRRCETRSSPEAALCGRILRHARERQLGANISTQPPLLTTVGHGSDALATPTPGELVWFAAPGVHVMLDGTVLMKGRRRGAETAHVSEDDGAKAYLGDHVAPKAFQGRLRQIVPVAVRSQAGRELQSVDGSNRHAGRHGRGGHSHRRRVATLSH